MAAGGDSDRSRVFTRRAFLIGGAQVGLFSLLASRLYYLQVMEGNKYLTLAEENRINLRLISPRRGQIFDRYGTLLANNQQNYRVILLPEQIKNLNETLDNLARYVEIDAADRKRIARDLNNIDNFNAVPAKDNLTWSQVANLSVHSLDLPGIDIDTGEVRTYTYGETTSHILGYTGTVSKAELDKSDDDDSKDNSKDDILGIPGFHVGKIGIEKTYDLDLRGSAGNEQMEVNAHGRVVRELARNNPKAGKDLSLSLDIGLQQFVQQRLMKEEGAAAVVMEAQTGAILSLVSHPSFDPNLFTYGIDQDNWDRLNNDEHSPMLNKVVSGVYAPGSTFKPVVMMAALEAGLVNPSAQVYCPGYFELGNHRFHCWKHGGHGYVNMNQALAGSCDTYFYSLGQDVGIDRIQGMAKRLGFGQKLGIDLPHERSGLIPGKTWKLATQGSLWQQGETLNTAIGQGYVLVSLLQLASMSARLCNGGKAVRPHIVKQIGGVDIALPDSPSLGFNQRNLNIVCNAMSSVVNEQIGTAYSARITKPEFAMAGKTGTSQVRHISETERSGGVTLNENLPWKQRDHALFTGFAPIGKPRYVVAALVEHGGSGAHIAAPIARDILLECQTKDQPPATEKK